MFANYDFYCNDYCMGRCPQILEDVFAFYEKEARRSLDYHTMERASYQMNQLNHNENKNKISEATCAVAEHLYNGGSDNDRKIKDILGTYLAHTGLLFRG